MFYTIPFTISWAAFDKHRELQKYYHIKLTNVAISDSYSCTWHGNPCDIENDFVLTLTDLGVCYTFNMKEPALHVSEPGI